MNEIYGAKLAGIRTSKTENLTEKAAYDCGEASTFHFDLLRKTPVVSFVATSKGVFNWWCSPGTPGRLGRGAITRYMPMEADAFELRCEIKGCLGEHYAREVHVPVVG